MRWVNRPSNPCSGALDDQEDRMPKDTADVLAALTTPSVSRRRFMAWSAVAGVGAAA